MPSPQKNLSNVFSFECGTIYILTFANRMVVKFKKKDVQKRIENSISCRKCGYRDEKVVGVYIPNKNLSVVRLYLKAKCMQLHDKTN